jgi:hypothetical protein
MSNEAINRRAFMANAARGCLGVSALPLVAQGATFHHAKRVIYVFLSGGLSHVDSFDPKPENKAVMGPSRAIPTSADNIFLGHHFAGLAKHMDKCAIIRSMTSKIGAHAEGQYLSHTGYVSRGTTRHPGLASWVARLAPRENPRLPSSVVVSESPQGLGSAPGFLGGRYAGLPIGDPAAGLQHSVIPPKIGGDRQNRRYAVAKLMNSTFLGGTRPAAVKGYDDAYAEAVQLMQSEDLQAFDISREPKWVRDRYGKSSFGDGCLLARRLVERGVRFVEVMSGGWDHHGNIAKALGDMAPVLDRGLSTLIDDLSQRGLLEDTLVVVGTEFGRTPMVNAKGGRDHHAPVYSQLMAGGGVIGGTIYGASDEAATELAGPPVKIQDFNATIGYALGVDPDETIVSPAGRPFTMANKGKPLARLFG